MNDPYFQMLCVTLKKKNTGQPNAFVDLIKHFQHFSKVAIHMLMMEGK